MWNADPKDIDKLYKNKVVVQEVHYFNYHVLVPEK